MQRDVITIRRKIKRQLAANAPRRTSNESTTLGFIIHV